MTTTKHTAHWTLQALAQAGVKTIVFSPGSRNAPLVIAAEALGSFTLEVLGDERSAGFNALGRSLVTGAPVVVVINSEPKADVPTLPVALKLDVPVSVVLPTAPVPANPVTTCRI